MTKTERVTIGLGSNLGDRMANLSGALERLSRLERVTLLRSSSFHETRPEGVALQPDFLNAVAEIETDLPPGQLLEQLQKIESDMGRTREVRWGPRTIDLDLLLYGSKCVHTPELDVPHPRMTERVFVLKPLAELIPDFVHPVAKKTIRQLLKEVTVAV